MGSKEGINGSRAGSDWSKVAQLKDECQIGCDRQISNDYADWYDTGVKNYSDFEKLSTDKQIKYVSDMIEAGEADTAYGIFEVLPILRNITSDKKLPPLVRIIAKSGERIDPNSASACAWRLEHEGKDDKRTFGYFSVVTPEQLSGITLTEEDMKLNEEQIKVELARVKNKRSKMRLSGYGSPHDNSDWQELYNRELELEFALERLYFTENQKRLHEEFPSLPHEKQLVKIASDAAATVAFYKKYDYDGEAWFSLSYSFELVSDVDGNIAPSSELESLLGTENDISLYVEMLHNSSQIESAVGINPVDLPLRSQAQFLKYLAEARDERFNKLSETLNAAKPKLRLKIAENFLSADFGEDFGDALLTIAGSEKLNDKEKGEVFDIISSCRKSIHKIVRLYSEIDDGQFMQEYARAANERLTDAIMVFSRIAEKGVASADLDWAGTPEFNFDSAMEALNYEAKSLEIISGTLDDVATGKEGAFAEIAQHPNSDQSSLWRTVYNFYSPNHGYILLYTRPEGSNSLDPAVDYGKKRNRYDTESANVGVEASISLIVNPVNPFSFPNPYKPDLKKMNDPLYYDSSKMDKVSAIRLDREGRAPGMSADDPKRDPVNTVGMVSVDLAAIGDRADTPSGKIARLLSVGGRLREEASGVESSLNHNTRWFSQKQYGTAEGFRRLVEYIDGLAREWCAEHGPKKDDESFSRKMKQVRGNKARRAA